MTPGIVQALIRFLHLKRHLSNLSCPYCKYTEAEAQLKAITTTSTTDSSRTSSEALNQNMRPTSSSSPHYASFFSTSISVSSEAEPAQFAGGAQSSSGGIAAITEYMLWIILLHMHLYSVEMKENHCK